MQKNYFIAQESSRYSVRKQDWFFLLFDVSQKIGFLYEWKLQWLPSSKDNAHVFTYKKSKKIAKRFKKKARQFPLRFCIQKAIHFPLEDFSWIFWSWHLYRKSIKLWVTWSFYIQKARHFAKTKIICNTFIYTKIRYFAFRDFSLDFWNLRRGGTFIH